MILDLAFESLQGILKQHRMHKSLLFLQSQLSLLQYFLKLDLFPCSFIDLLFASFDIDFDCSVGALKLLVKSWYFYHQFLLCVFLPIV
jgi:hypothetical protein